MNAVIAHITPESFSRMRTRLNRPPHTGCIPITSGLPHVYQLHRAPPSPAAPEYPLIPRLRGDYPRFGRLRWDAGKTAPRRREGREAVVAAVNGVCHAGGLDLVLFSDIAIASEDARFRAPELLRGARDPWIAAPLAEYVGIGIAKYLLYTAPRSTRARHWQWGSSAASSRGEGFAQSADDVCQQIRRTASGARAMLKEVMSRSLPVPEVQMFHRAINSPELAEGLSAFLEKRAPRWRRESV